MSRWPTTNERAAAAVHEAGHAIVARELGWSVHMVSLRRFTDCEATVTLRRAPGPIHPDLARAVVYLAGGIAERRWCETRGLATPRGTDASDLELAAQALASFGSELRAEARAEVERYAHTVLGGRWEHVERIACRLLRSDGHLCGDEIAALLAGPVPFWSLDDEIADLERRAGAAA